MVTDQQLEFIKLNIGKSNLALQEATGLTPAEVKKARKHIKLATATKSPPAPQATNIAKEQPQKKSKANQPPKQENAMQTKGRAVALTPTQSKINDDIRQKKFQNRPTAEQFVAEEGIHILDPSKPIQ